ncbi:nucleotide-binding protein [Xanthomonas euvesicatoria]|uniref:TIR domain-containing protein n=1 Tax=Lysobacteraceae TaxID=32033 RepID=UPI000C162321|nr:MULTISPECIES: TIR domain-containing protein [Xanthomonadaceae]MCC8514931.1 nucleotide-binding protein [Xanthomonas euvesicatoria pv. euvesicatoria]MCC8546629.1 nucleotide-binding protein [Xanthomonas euvesicatoria pv. euvesicatoria]MCC8583820.1 nucleotide-binding protein [Xanthomonas euvesicatoria pv. euvesicatoria]MCC8592113.1 nucleotide-binding protein [Xanthomonas euvesicatoria pv. euvesicatoria]MCC8612761.1 nucleotide-binding protein [Xanthomonas euvesicatoria pv. euvesicatoria]
MGASIIERLSADGGRRLVAALAEFRTLAGLEAAATQLAEAGELLDVAAGASFITQEDAETDVFFIVAGAVDVIINGKVVNTRRVGEHVGEMAAIEPTQLRAATITATEPTVVLKVPESDFSRVADAHPLIWRRLAAALSRRLKERNRMITAPRERVRVFVMSSVEALPVTRLLVQHFEHDPFLTVVWDHGVFRAANYTLDELEAQLEQADFAIAVAHADDMVISRGDEWPVMRDNVVFELGMFIGFLGRRRAFLMEPREDKLKLPSDLAGLTTVPYRYKPGADARALLAPACEQIRARILAAGPRD